MYKYLKPMGKKLEEFDRLKLVNNPFAYSMEIPVIKVYSDKLFEKIPVPDLATGETEHVYLPSGYYAEQQQSVKIYYCTKCKNLIASMSDKAQRLYLHVLYHLEKKVDYFQLNKEDYMRKNNIKSNTTFLAAVEELVTFGVIGLTGYKSVFWVNPILFFPGDRVSRYPEQIVNKWPDKD